MKSFNIELYKYIKDSQTNRYKYILKWIVTWIALVATEIQFLYSSLQFNVTQCRYLIDGSGSSSISNSTNSGISNSTINSFTFSNCIEADVPFCISDIYGYSTPSLSFTVPIFYNPDKQLLDCIIFFIICLLLFFTVSMIFAYNSLVLYITKSRVQLLLGINILTIPKPPTRKRKIWMGIVVSACIAYTLLKYITAQVLETLINIINCGNNTIELEFDGRNIQSIFHILLNAFVYLFFFSDYIHEFITASKQWYSDISLPDFLLLRKSDLLDRFSSIEFVEKDNIKKAMRTYIDTKYSQESKMSRNRRVNIFRSFRSSKNDIIEAVLDFKQENPQYFTSLNSRIENLNENDNLIN